MVSSPLDNCPDASRDDLKGHSEGQIDRIKANARKRAAQKLAREYAETKKRGRAQLLGAAGPSDHQPNKNAGGGVMAAGSCSAGS
jgi:hypothetical protein